MGKKGPVIKNEASLVTTLFFENFVLVLEFDVPTTQMFIFILSERVEVLFEGTFFLYVSVNVNATSGFVTKVSSLQCLYNQRVKIKFSLLDPLTFIFCTLG